MCVFFSAIIDAALHALQRYEQIYILLVHFCNFTEKLYIYEVWQVVSDKFLVAFILSDERCASFMRKAGAIGARRNCGFIRATKSQVGLAGATKLYNRVAERFVQTNEGLVYTHVSTYSTSNIRITRAKLKLCSSL